MAVGSGAHSTGLGQVLHQPRSVWAVAFSCVVAFMGIGLVDPILPAISDSLHASQAQAMLLFTSYLVITGAAMFFTSFISARLGAKTTLLLGLGLIVIFAALAGLSGSVGQVIGFRAGWGLGNALFISTALATIVGAASGGIDSAIILYEAALGVGIAIGPLLGGLLGGISWRGPFFGTAVLMTIGLVGLLASLPSQRGPKSSAPRISITATFAALGHPTLLGLAMAALFYNFAFFVLLAYTPFPLHAAAHAQGLTHFGAHELGLIFCGWGLGLAVTSVFVAPRLTQHFGRSGVLLVSLAGLAGVELIMALQVRTLAVLIAATVAAGLFQGVMNTVLTETVMAATDLPRSVASSTYSGVRFLGGAIAPAIAGVLAASFGAAAPYWLGVGALLVSFAVVVLIRPLLARIEPQAEPELAEAEAISAGV